MLGVAPKKKKKPYHFCKLVQKHTYWCCEPPMNTSDVMCFWERRVVALYKVQHQWLIVLKKTHNGAWTFDDHVDYCCDDARWEERHLVDVEEEEKTAGCRVLDTAWSDEQQSTDDLLIALQLDFCYFALFQGSCWTVEFLPNFGEFETNVHALSAMLHVSRQSTVEPLFTYSIGQKWLYLLQKVLKMRCGFP